MLSEAIRVLTSGVRVVPICAGLIDLYLIEKLRTGSVDYGELTVKLYVMDDPGGTSHCVTPTGPSISFVPFWNMPWK